jgi:hypothetical protein
MDIGLVHTDTLITTCVIISEVVVVVEASQGPTLVIVDVPYSPVLHGRRIDGIVHVYLPSFSTCHNLLDVTIDAVGKFQAVLASTQ